MAGVIARRGDIERALGLWRDSLALWDQIGDVGGKAATLHDMAGVIARRGDIERALGLWRDSLALWDQIGDVRGKAATLHQMAGVIAQRGDIERALGLWRDSLALWDQIGDVGGKAATLHQMAGVIARRGDIERALGLWRDSLALWDQIGDVGGKAATLHKVAGVIARRGDIERALGLWRDSLALWEQIGDVRGKAATLHNMAWLAASQGDREQARPLYLQSAQALVAIRAWPNLATVLWNLGALDEEDTIAFLGQALWLVLHVQVPLENLLGLASALLQKLGFGAEPAPLFAAAAVLRVQAQGQDHPEAEQLQGRALRWLWKCAEERGIIAEQFEAWLTGQRLNGPGHVLPAAEQALAQLVGDANWLFDRAAVLQTD